MGNRQRTGNMHKAALEIRDREAVYVYLKPTRECPRC